MKKNGFISTSLIVVSSFVMIGAGVYFLATKQSTKSAIQQTPNPIAVDKAPNWKTYKNKQYGFEIKYPTEAEEVKIQALLNQNIFFALKIDSTKNAEIGTINMANCYYSPLDRSIAQKTLVVNGANFCLNVEEDSGTGGQTYRDYYYTTKKGDQTLIVSFHVLYNKYCGETPEYNCAKFDEIKDTAIFDQIISTFKFVN